MLPLVRIEMFGGLRMIRGEQVVSRFRTRKTGALLAYLASFSKRNHPREILTDLFWQEDDPEASRHSLSTALSSLRPLLEPTGEQPDGSVLYADRHMVGLVPGAITTDVAEFESSIAAASRSQGADQEALLRRAIDLRQGEFLSGYYMDWVFLEQQRLEELYFQARNLLVSILERDGQIDRALQVALGMVSDAALPEEACEEVRRLYIAAGRPEAARRQYAVLNRILEAEVGETVRPKFPSPKAGRKERPTVQPVKFEGSGGAVPLDSAFYVERPADAGFLNAVAQRAGIVLVKGARQVGKTSLLARGLQKGRSQGLRVVLTSLQSFFTQDFESPDRFLRTLAEAVADQVDGSATPSEVWDERRAATSNFRRYLSREVLGAGGHLVWGLDEVDRLFGCPFGSDVFALFRSWHDARALDPEGPWSRLTLALAYSTEAHLFITDINQSPFNVGLRLSLSDFTIDHIADLNHRHGSPLNTPDEVGRLYATVGGQPFLVRQGLYILCQSVTLSELEARATDEDWIFGEHLRRIRTLIAKDSELENAMHDVEQGRKCGSREAFERLRAAGILSGETAGSARFRCPLYARYLSQRFS